MGLKPSSLWLLPAEPYYQQMKSTIAELCKEYDAPAFEPHVTLISGQVEEADMLAALMECATTCQPFVAPIVSVGHSKNLFKTLYFEFPDKDFSQLRNAVARHVSYDSYNLHPHLSLLYKELPSSQRQLLARGLDGLEHKVVFDRVALQVPGRSESDFSKISAWQIRDVKPLMGRL